MLGWGLWDAEVRATARTVGIASGLTWTRPARLTSGVSPTLRPTRPPPRLLRSVGGVSSRVCPTPPNLLHTALDTDMAMPAPTWLHHQATNSRLLPTSTLVSHLTLNLPLIPTLLAQESAAEAPRSAKRAPPPRPPSFPPSQAAYGGSTSVDAHASSVSLSTTPRLTCRRSPRSLPLRPSRSNMGVTRVGVLLVLDWD